MALLRSLLFLTSLCALAQDIPTLYLIGDSTVRNGKGDGSNGQWGWGDRLAPHFDTTRIHIVNKALGGRSSRTFIAGGQWAAVMEALKPGDFVLMQFGHNDASPLDDKARPRGTLKGIGEETEKIDNPITGKHEVVHTYGWYMRQFIAGAREKGALPMICTPIPRNNFKEGKLPRSEYQTWSEETAAAAKIPLFDIADLTAPQHEAIGPDKVEPLFHGDHTHTGLEAAKINQD